MWSCPTPLEKADQEHPQERPNSPSDFSTPAGPRPWVLDAGMYEPLYYAFDAYPTIIPRVRVRGVMALFLAVSILWALIW